jgi:hypothetical protein
VPGHGQQTPGANSDTIDNEAAWTTITGAGGNMDSAGDESRIKQQRAVINNNNNNNNNNSMNEALRHRR